MTAKFFGFSNEKIPLYDLATHILLTAFSTLGDDRVTSGLEQYISPEKQTACYTFLDDWNNSDDSEKLFDMADNISRHYNLTDRLKKVNTDILLKADKMSMAHSLELRVPFLDKKVLEFAETVPVDYRIQGTDTKIVMRHAANKTLPDEWANRPKKGFPVPIRYWLREEKYYNIVKEYFTSDYAAVFFKPDALMKLLDDHFHERANNQRKIWTVFTFLVWYKRFFVDEK